MGSLDFRADQRQQQTLSPKLQHAVRLLQMSSLDFAQCVQQVMGKNPFLETEEVDETRPDDFAGAQPETASESAAQDVLLGEGGAFETSDPRDSAHTGDSDREIWQAEGGSGRRTDGDELSMLDRIAAESSLAAHLHAQLNAQPVPARDLALARVIVDSLDDDGYLRSALDELGPLADLRPPAAAAEMALALQRVQSLEPAGVGARNVAECLRLQLPRIECPQLRGWAEQVIDDHLPLLASRDVNGLARALALKPTEVEAVCDRIRHLDPRPGWRVGGSDVQYVVPDVIARKVRGVWTVQLNPAVVPKVKLNQVYADMFQRCKPEQNAAMASHLQEARWTVRNVEQRFCTILDVAQSIVRRQQHFLDFGPMAMKPLGLREIADELGMHESTVSRVTNNKYLATPSGVFELKYFFSRAMVTASGSACSGTAIRGLIKDMIELEKPVAPLSDAEIARQLARQGLTVARRTVTKYRQVLRIEPVERRRRYGETALA
ncbi:MAG TPA: RNA polymerase factor sigma-54 [Rubrivivax sp.]